MSMCHAHRSRPTVAHAAATPQPGNRSREEHTLFLTRWYNYQKRLFILRHQRFPIAANPALRKHRPATSRSTHELGMLKRFGANKKRKPPLDFRTYCPPRGYVVPRKPVNTVHWLHRDPPWYRDRPQTLNVEYCCALARKHFGTQKAEYMVKSYRYGFLDHYEGPRFTQALTPNFVEPGDPGTSAVNEQLLRIAGDGMVWYSTLPFAETKVLPISIVSKPRLDGTIKLRPTAGGNYPGEPDEAFSRKAHTPRRNVQYSIERTSRQIAKYVLHPPKAAILADLKSAFEKLPKHKYEIASNCYFWDLTDDWEEFARLAKWAGEGPPATSGWVYCYMGVHIFGLSGTPAAADNAFGLIALEQQEIADLFPGRCFLSRRTDDTIFTMDDELQPYCNELATKLWEVNTRSGHVLQPDKVMLDLATARFDGYLWDFSAESVGIPPDKGKSINDLIQTFLRRKRHRDADTASDHTRKLANTLQGKLEHAAIAAPSILVFLVAFRECWQPLARSTSTVRLTDEARADLQRLSDILLANNFTLMCKWKYHFVASEPSVILATDASGLAGNGIGGYTYRQTGKEKGNRPFFINATWSSLLPTPERITDDDVATGIIEFAALWAMLSIGCWTSTTIMWYTDSNAAVGAWNKGRGGSPFMNRAVKQIAFVLARAQVILTCEHRSRKLPIIDAADALSRQDTVKFLEVTRGSLTLQHRFAQRDLKCPTTGFKSRLTSLLSAE